MVGETQKTPTAPCAPALRLLAAFPAVMLAGCGHLSVMVEAEAPPIADLGPLPAMPAPPLLDVKAVGAHVCIPAEGALDLAQYLSVDLPGWRARAEAAYEFYRSDAVEGEAAP